MKIEDVTVTLHLDTAEFEKELKNVVKSMKEFKKEAKLINGTIKGWTLYSRMCGLLIRKKDKEG